jgi:hypothetical protein
MVKEINTHAENIPTTVGKVVVWGGQPNSVCGLTLATSML